MLTQSSAGGFAPPASDRMAGPFWVVLGAAITAGALRIDRLEAQGVEWFAAPGLLPGILGVIMALCGVLISLRAWRAPALAVPDEEHRIGLGRIALTLALCLGFAIGLVGHGLHFGMAAMLYLFAHISLLQWHERGERRQRLRGLLVAAAVAVGAGLAVPFVFEQIFLVRLP